MFRTTIKNWFVAGLLIGLLSACAPSSESTATVSSAGLTEAAPAGPATLRVMTHDSFAISETVLQKFEEENGVKVQFLKSGDAGAAVNKAILSKDAPLADVFYGVDNTFLSRALEAGIFEAYSSPRLAEIPQDVKLDPENRALPVDYGDVCLNFDKIFFAESNLKAPDNLEDLLKPEYRDMLVVQNPATSSPGLAFLLATIGHFGEEDYLQYWKGLRENNVLVVNDWETAYRTEFSMSGGTRPIVVSYASSPPFEVIFAEEPVEEPPTAAVVSDESCFRQIEFAGILAGTENRKIAEAWIDFMLSPAFQEDIPLQMFVFPVNPAARLDETFTRFLKVPESTAFVSPEAIAANRETWIEAWRETVLR